LPIRAGLLGRSATVWPVNEYAQFCALMAQVIPAFLIAYALERQATGANDEGTDNLGFDIPAIGVLALGEILALWGAFPSSDPGKAYGAVVAAFGFVGVVFLVLHFIDRWAPTNHAAMRTVRKHALLTALALAVIVGLVSFAIVQLGGS